jgi:glycosyltransferase involved in cell wall biosynthesis
MSKPKPDFSLILACYKEEAHLAASIQEIIDVLDLSKYRYEIIMVDDCSPDGTRDLIKKIIKKHKNKNIKALFHEKNLGRGGAVTTGIRAAEADIVGYIDADIEVSPVYIPYCVNKVAVGNDVVIGMRVYKINNLRGAARNFTHWFYLQLVRHLVGVKFLHDTETGYKFFPRDKILPILDKCENSHWFWSTEVVAHAFILDYKFVQVPCLYMSKEKTTVKVVIDSFLYFKSLIKFVRREKKALKAARRRAKKGSKS